MIHRGRIQHVGTRETLNYRGSGRPEVIDCQGKTILPGFIDAHLHLSAFAESLVTINLGSRHEVHSIADVQSRIRAISQGLPPGSWVRGQAYNEFYLSEKRHPTRWDLDQATLAHPVKLTHRSGHAHVLNSPALNLAGISKETADPPGGLIDREISTGEPTGLLFEMGTVLSKLIPSLCDQELERGVKQASDELLAFGITSIQDASARNDFGRLKTVQSWKRKGLLKPRVSMMLGLEGFEELENYDFFTHESRDLIRFSGVKMVLDETTGQLHPSQSELNRLVLKIHEAGWQIAIHAIEENAVDSACSAVEYALERLPRLDHRHRIEHCSVCPPALSNRLASSGIMVVTQPSFIYYNGDRYLKSVPDRQFQHLYPIGTLIKSGIKVAGSSDCPVVPPNPLMGIYSAVSRMAETGEPVLPEECIGSLDALRIYTEYAARASFREAIKGTISPGKLADLVVLNGDPTSVPIDEIKDMEVEMTILGGQVVWSKGK